MARVQLAALTLCAAAIAATVDVPKFWDYPATPVYRGLPAAPRFRPGEDLYPNGGGHFRSGVEFDAAGGPNFAGHYTIAQWTCGTGCTQMVVVDTQNGRIFREMPYETLDIDRYVPPRQIIYRGASFRKDSRLLVVEGCYDRDFRAQAGKAPDCARRYCVWEGARFRLLRRIGL